MNILFLTIVNITDIGKRGIYTDLLRELSKRNHNLYIASPAERRLGIPTTFEKKGNAEFLQIRTLNLQKANIIEKGIGMLLVENQFSRAISRYWGDVNFDLVLYSTPPITLNKVIESVRRRCSAHTYLMLKDIFPQNAVDLDMMKENGPLHRFFRKKEQHLYEISDHIGCMSPANCKYVIDHNPEVNPGKVELCPNSIALTEQTSISADERRELLARLGIPSDKTIFIYGGNLGKPQGLDFLLKVVEANETRNNSFIIIVGNGTEYPKIKGWFELHNPKNAKLLDALPKEDYDRLVRVCDVGLIFLNSRFTIPNFPSRLLSYLENSMPVLLATDINTDMGRIAESEGFGIWCENGDIDRFMANMDSLTTDSVRLKDMGKNGYTFLVNNYTVEKTADIITMALKK